MLFSWVRQLWCPSFWCPQPGEPSGLALGLSFLWSRTDVKSAAREEVLNLVNEVARGLR